jgi:hypothetical protein
MGRDIGEEPSLSAMLTAILPHRRISIFTTLRASSSSRWT